MGRLLNERLADRDYGSGLEESGWFLLFVFAADDFPGAGTERMLYKRASRDLDLRLRVDHEAWRTADADERHRLLYDVARRSFDIMRKKKIPDLDVDRFESDVEEIAHEQGWVR